MRFEGRVAIITGSSRNVGRGIALRLAEEGADIVANYVSNADAALETINMIKILGRKAMAIQADVSNYNKVNDMINRTIDNFGRVDILVNNAGIASITPIWDVMEEEFDKTISINLKGVFNCCKAVIKHMMNRRYGKIINISSLAGVSGLLPASVHYCASKGGIISLTKSLANQVAPFNINVNAIAPGQLDSPSIRWRTPEQIEELK
ncbi:MAG: SDR family NAD(P)-dependent oxidoreductase, partial [Dehalococcoidia bacterium]